MDSDDSAPNEAQNTEGVAERRERLAALRNRAAQPRSEPQGQADATRQSLPQPIFMSHNDAQDASSFGAADGHSVLGTPSPPPPVSSYEQAYGGSRRHGGHEHYGRGSGAGYRGGRGDGFVHSHGGGRDYRGRGRGNYRGGHGRGRQHYGNQDYGGPKRKRGQYSHGGQMQHSDIGYLKPSFLEDPWEPLIKAMGQQEISQTFAK